jgi:hypothetical protein
MFMFVFCFKGDSSRQPRATSMAGSRSFLSTLLKGFWIASLIIPHTTSLDEGAHVDRGGLQICEARVRYLTAEVGRLQTQLALLQGGGEKVARPGPLGSKDRAIGRGVGPSAASAGSFTPSVNAAARKGALDVHRRRQERSGIPLLGPSSCSTHSYS